MNKLILYLYSAVPWDQKNQPLIFSWSRLVKRWLRRMNIQVNWIFRRELVGHFSDLLAKNFSNRGDIALSFAAREQLTVYLAPNAIEFREIAWGKLDSDKIEEINRSADAFIIGGGGFFFFNPDGRLSASRKLDCNTIPLITCPIFCFGTGANMLQYDRAEIDVVLDPSEREAITNLGRSIQFGFVRDSLAAELLGAAGTDVIQTIDPAFMLTQDNGSVAIDRVYGMANVGINLAIHGSYPYELQKKKIAEYLPFLKTISDRDDIRLHYFVHENGEYAFSNLLRLAGIKFDLVDVSPEEMMSAYARMDLHICQMMHSAIFSTSCAVPTLCLSYDAKHIMFFETLGLSEWCLPAATVTTLQLEEHFNALWTKRVEIHKHLRSKKLELTDSYYNALKKLTQAILHHQEFDR